MIYSIILCFFIRFILGFSQVFAAENPSLRIAVVQEFGSFNPITINLASSEAFLHFLLRGLTVQDNQGKVIPDLAEKVPTFQNKLAQVIRSNKGKKIKAQWTIKALAKWSDGTPVTCQDWWLGWQVGLSANTMTQEKTLYTKIESIEWPPDHKKKCSVTYNSDSWTFDRDLPYPIPFHLENSIFNKWQNQKSAYDQNSLYVTAPKTLGLYNGPYQIEDFKLGSYITLIPNKTFFERKPLIKKILIQHIGESNSLLAHLKTKSINMISAVGFPPDLALSLIELEKDLKMKVVFQDSPVFQGLFFNHEKQPVSELAVRKAIRLAIDKKKLTDAFFRSKIKPAETFIPPYFKEFIQRPRLTDKKQAQRILDDAGWISIGRNNRVKNGKELVIEFKTSSGIKILETIQVFICSELSQIQIGCSIKNQPPRILLGDTTSHGEFEMALYGSSILPDTSLTSLFSSNEIPTQKNSWTGANTLRWKSAAADRLLKQFDHEKNKVKREKLMLNLEKEIFEHVAFIPIYHRREAILMPKNLQNFTILGKGTNFMFPEKWTLNEP